jgi:uncharacterized protein YcbK (DUF882 family)
MGDMTENFNRAEFACKCHCGLNLVRPRLVLLLQAIREHFDKPVRVVSGTRCPRRNRQVGGARKSQHLLGTAADIQIEGVSPQAVARFAATLLLDSGGIKAYATFTHVDIRPGRWRG